MEHVRLRELAVAARVADALVYAAGVAGVVAGGLLFREGEPVFAVVVWIVTFIAGAALRLASWGARALAEILERTRRLEDDVARLAPPSPGADAPRRPGEPPDPYRRWGGWH